MRIRILPYRQGSQSARALAEALGGRVLRLQGSTFRARRDDILINWGNSDPPQPQYWNFGRVINNHNHIRDASNKLLFFQRMPEDIIPRFWTRREDIPDDAFPIVCRTTLAGHSGDGIVMASRRDELVNARLYVQYIKKISEFRIHVGKRPWVPHRDYAGEQMPDGEFRDDPVVIISEQKKARRLDVENPNWQIRNHANGFTYQRHDIEVPESVREVARRALRSLEIDFGAVDVIYNGQQRRPYVLEVNTAPGLEGQTVTDYATFFRSVTATRMRQ